MTGKWSSWRDVAADLLGLIGLAAVIIGVAHLSRPGAIIFFGVTCLLVAVRLAGNRLQPQSKE